MPTVIHSLDGNGRTIMVVHSVLAQRAGFSVDWARTGKAEYLGALTQELDAPGKGILDHYLKLYVAKAIAYDELAGALSLTPGLDGSEGGENTVLGKTSEPEVKARYQQQKIKRGRTKWPETDH